MASVLVVGAGLAGLACAWRLQRAGYDVELLERAAEPGGRARSREVEGFRIEPGYRFFSSSDHGLHGIARHVGLAGSVQSVLRFPDALETGAGFSALRPVEDPLFLRTHALRRSEALRLGRLRLDALRWRGQLEPVSPAALAALDAEPVAAWLDRRIGAPLRSERVVPYASALVGFDAEALSALALLRFADRYRSARPQYMVEGLGALATSLAEGANIRFGCEVTAVEGESDGARVRYRVGSREGRGLADAVVVAVEAPEIPGICPKLAPAERGFFDSLTSVGRTVVHLLLDAPPSIPHRLVAFPPRDGFGLAALEVANHLRGAAPSGRGLLRVTLAQGADEKLCDATDDEITGLVLDNLERSRVRRIRPAAALVDRIAHAATLPRPGFFGALARFSHRIERSPRTAFAGDFFVGQGPDAAIASGLRAASEIAHSLPVGH